MDYIIQNAEEIILSIIDRHMSCDGCCNTIICKHKESYLYVSKYIRGELVKDMLSDMLYLNKESKVVSENDKEKIKIGNGIEEARPNSLFGVQFVHKGELKQISQ